jgi:predicted CoA-binding protein
MPQLDPYNLLTNKNMSIALVGATNHKAKYGNIIFHNLLNKDHLVYPVNEKATTIDGHKCYKNLAELKEDLSPKKIDIINIVIPPKLGLILAEIANKLNLNNLWYQPGAESDEIIKKCIEVDLDFIVNACIMVVSKR